MRIRFTYAFFVSITVIFALLGSILFISPSA